VQNRNRVRVSPPSFAEFSPPDSGESPFNPRPLADELRPATFDQVVGQDHLLGPNGAIARMVKTGKLMSFILWGPPGVGKTTIARILASAADMHFVQMSAVFSGVADLRKVFEEAAFLLKTGRQTLLFIDEIHRFNRSQQDGFLPYVENGTVVLVGATTENPSFELNGALLSRCQVFVLNRLDDDAFAAILARAEDLKNRPLPATDGAKEALKAMADGDGRYYINLLEILFDNADHDLSEQELADFVHKRLPIYDKDREEHYNLISALHKSLRGSDTDAALYWLARMLDGGEDPKYILRRLTRFAFEDVSLADPQAVHQALAAWEIYERLGSPEGDLAIAQLAIYLGTAPKTNSAYIAWGAARRAARQYGTLMPPKHILNAPTKLMKELGYSQGYQYDHDTELGFSGQNYFPDGMNRQEFYKPIERGFEREIKKRLEYWASLRRKLQK